MSKITNDGLTRSGTGYALLIAVPIWQQWASKGQSRYLVLLWCLGGVFGELVSRIAGVKRSRSCDVTDAFSVRLLSLRERLTLSSSSSSSWYHRYHHLVVRHHCYCCWVETWCLTDNASQSITSSRSKLVMVTYVSCCWPLCCAIALLYDCYDFDIVSCNCSATARRGATARTSVAAC